MNTNQTSQNTRISPIKFAILLGVHFSLFIFTALLIWNIIDHKYFPNNFSFSDHDTGYYFRIKDTLYHSDDWVHDVAFFPLFSFLWKLLGVDDIRISIVNVVIYCFSIYLLTKDLVISQLERMIILAIPSFLFFFVPYSEALFLLCLSLYGYCSKEKKYLGMFFCLFLASMTRSAINILLPAVLVAELIQLPKLIDLKRLIVSILGLLIGLFVVVLIQYKETGHWFIYMQAQKLWGHKFGLPKIPFSTFGNPYDHYLPAQVLPTFLGRTLNLDVIALLIGLISIFLCFRLAYQRFFLNKLDASFLELLGMISVAGFTLFAVFFKGGLLFSLNRYIFPTAMFIWLLSFTKKLKIQSKWFIIIYLLLFLSTAIFRPFVTLDSTLFFVLTPGIICILLLDLSLTDLPKFLVKTIHFVFYILLLISQSWFFLRHTSGAWVA